MKSCPHCHNALRWMEELKKTDQRYNKVEVTIIDETLQPEIATQYDYYYVPTYYVGSVKVHEGVPT